jgi:hypothetical protein
MEKIEVGDFIKIPTWRVEGCVVALRPATLGSDDAQEVLLQTSPEQTEGMTWYRLEPNEYEEI